MKHTNLLLAGILAVSVQAVADTRLEFSTGEGKLSQFTIKGDRVRMEEPGDQVVTLFDAKARELLVIEPANRRYYRMDAAQMKRQGQQISEQMRQMREQMEQQLQNLPEEQRAMMREQMEQMMQSQMSGQQAGPRDIRIERGGSGRVAGIDCQRVTVYANGNVSQRLCIADVGGLGIPAADMRTLRAMFSMFAEMAVGFGAAGDDMDAPAPASVLQEFRGIPIEGKDAGGSVEWALQSVRELDADAADFRVPNGYREVDPFSMDAAQ